MIYVIKLNDQFKEECSLAVFLQGLINRTEKRLFLDYEHYLDYLDERYVVTTLQEAIQIFSEDIQGLVIYDFNHDDVSINMAASISAVRPWLGVPRQLLHWEVFQSIPVKMDLATILGTNVERQRQIFHQFKEEFSRDGLIHQVVAKDNFHWQLRDFGISQQWFTLYTKELEEDKEFRHEVFQWLDRNTPIYGWNDDEISFIKDASQYGCFTIPMDWSINHSYLSSVHSVKVNQRYQDDDKMDLEPVHYLSIVVSDGDNVQWLERDFSTTSNYGQRINDNQGFKMTWTVAPYLSQMSPKILEYIYNNADQDYFISGVSGMGYMNTLEYPIEHLKEFATKSGELFESADIKVICMLDNIANTKNSVEVVKRLDYFANLPSLKGGIWELDPDRYESGKGQVFWSTNGKPFISVRLSLWHPSNDKFQVDEKWIMSYVDQINHFPVNPTSIEGYTVLNVHPWTTNMKQLNFLVSKLEKHVKIVSAGEMIQLVKNHVSHQ